MQTAKITAFVFGLALVTSACGDSMSSLNPTAPSSLSPDSLNVQAGAAVAESGSMGNAPKPGNGNGNGSGNGNGNGNGNQQPTSTNTSPTATRVQFEGLIDAVGSNSIKVNGLDVTVVSTTVIRHGDIHYQLSALQRGDRVHVVAMRLEANGVVSHEAVEVKLQNPGESSGEEPPPPPPSGTVSVVAFDADAVEGLTNKAVFRFTRDGDASLLASSLTVSYSLAGSATSADYSMPATAVFPANVASVDVELTAAVDSATEGTETVVLTLTSASPYTLGASASATVNIADPPPSGPTVSVTAQASSISASSTGMAFGVFVLTRTGNLTTPLTVNFSVTGTAAAAYGGELGTSLTFPANDSEETLFFIAFQGGATGTVVLTVLDGAAYDPGASPSATITVTQ